MSSDPTPNSLAKKFFVACLLVLGGCLALSLAVGLLSRIWPWLLAGLIVTALIAMGILIWRWRRSRWM